MTDLEPQDQAATASTGQRTDRQRGPTLAITLLSGRGEGGTAMSQDAMLVRLERRSRQLLTSIAPRASRVWPGPTGTIEPGQDVSAAETVLLHDARYPFVTTGQLHRLLHEAVPILATGQAQTGLGVVEVTDSLKRIDPQGRVSATLDRSRYRALVGTVVTTGPMIIELVSALQNRADQAGQRDLAEELLAHQDRYGAPAQVDLSASAGQPGANAAIKVLLQEESSLAYAEAIWASSTSATATSSR